MSMRKSIGVVYCRIMIIAEVYTCDVACETALCLSKRLLRIVLVA